MAKTRKPKNANGAGGREPLRVALLGTTEQVKHTLKTLTGLPGFQPVGALLRRDDGPAPDLGIPEFPDLLSLTGAVRPDVLVAPAPSAEDARLLRDELLTGHHVMAMRHPAGGATEIADAAGRGKLLIGNPLFFTPGFLKLNVLMNGGKIGTPKSARAVRRTVCAGETGRDFTPHIEELFYLVARVVRADAEATWWEAPDTEWRRFRFECTLRFPNGMYGAVELREPEKDAPEYELCVNGTEGALRWRYSPGGPETLVIEIGDRVDGQTLSGPAPEAMAFIAMADFIRRDIEPYMGPAECRRAAAWLSTVEKSEPATQAHTLRALLVNTPRYRVEADAMYIPSLGTARLAAYLKAFGFPVAQLDLDALACARDKINISALNDQAAVDAYLSGGKANPALRQTIERVAAHFPAEIEGVVGFSIVDFYGRFQLNMALCLAKALKERHKEITVVFGGVGDEIRPDDTLRDHADVVDFIIELDGEAALVELMRALERNDRPSAFIPNVCLSLNGTVWRNRQELLPLRMRPAPDFDGVPLELYRREMSLETFEALEKKGIRAEPRSLFYLPYYNVKGCAYKCLFCGFGYYLDMQPVEKTVRELKELRDRYDTRYFFFWNTTFNMTRRYADELCDAIIAEKLDIRWTDSARPHMIDEKLAKKMARAGCILLNFGLESASDNVLKHIRKGFTGKQAEEALRAVEAAGIMTRVNLIAGFFHEKPEDVAVTAAFLERNARAIDMIGCFNGFYLNNGIIFDAKELGIRMLGRQDVIFSGQESLAYDEVGGYAWEEKKKAIAFCREELLGVIRRCGIHYDTAIDEYDLFFLYDLFSGDKEKVKRYLFRNVNPSI